MARPVWTVNWPRLNAIFSRGWRRFTTSTTEVPRSWARITVSGLAKNSPATSGISLIENEWASRRKRRCTTASSPK